MLVEAAGAAANNNRAPAASVRLTAAPFGTARSLLRAQFVQ
jgi:hypothetical protein